MKQHNTAGLIDYSSDHVPSTKVTEAKIEPLRISPLGLVPAHRTILYVGQITSPT
jgi:hypothetical protein